MDESRSSIKLNLFDEERSSFGSDFFEKIAQETVAEISYKKPAMVNVIIVSDRKMAQLNFKYRGKDCSTDVLSFSAENKDFVQSVEEENLLGEVLISLAQAKRQAEIAGHSLEQEMALLFVHGLLHLFGYDHEKSESETKLMDKKQETILIKSKLK